MSEKDLVPEEKECFALLKKYKVPINIIRHSEKVRDFSIELACNIEKKGAGINKKLVVAGALLHDLDKAETLDNRNQHGLIAFNELKKLGMLSVARIAKTHILDSILENDLKTLEEKIVYYADKRVLQDCIVGLDERFEYLRQRYGLKDKHTMKIINLSYEKVVLLEKELLEWKKSNCSQSLK